MSAVSKANGVGLYLKPVVMRVSPRWNCCCAEFNHCSSCLKFVDNIKYFNIYMKAGSKFSCCDEHLKLRFYSSFNALYRRSNSSHSELASVQLLQLFCLPVILYGSDVTQPQKSVLTVLNNFINRAVYRIYKVSDKDVICRIKQCLGLHDIDVLCKEKHERFLRKTGLLRHAVLHSLTAQYSFYSKIFLYFSSLKNFLGVHDLYVLCFYVLILILYVLLCCHVRRNKDTHSSLQMASPLYVTSGFENPRGNYLPNVRGDIPAFIPAKSLVLS